MASEAEFQVGDVIVQIGKFDKWLVDERPITCYRIKKVASWQRRIPVLGANNATVSRSYASRNFVKVGHRSKWRCEYVW